MYRHGQRLERGECNVAGVYRLATHKARPVFFGVVISKCCGPTCGVFFSFFLGGPCRTARPSAVLLNALYKKS